MMHVQHPVDGLSHHIHTHTHTFTIFTSILHQQNNRNRLIPLIMLATYLSRVVLMVRPGDGLAKALEFYTTGLGLHVARVTDEWADLRTTTSSALSQQQQQPLLLPPSLSICLQVVTSEAQVTTGYSPILQFQVANMDACITKCVQLGGQLDGPIQYPAHGKMAVVRSPDGHMIGIYEPASVDDDTTTTTG